MANEIEEWAMDRATELVSRQKVVSYPPAYMEAFARYIMEHEEEPVDPLLIEARKIAATHPSYVAMPTVAEAIIAGDIDSDGFLNMALAGLRRGIELAKDGS